MGLRYHTSACELCIVVHKPNRRVPGPPKVGCFQPGPQESSQGYICISNFIVSLPPPCSPCSLEWQVQMLHPHHRPPWWHIEESKYLLLPSIWFTSQCHAGLAAAAFFGLLHSGLTQGCICKTPLKQYSRPYIFGKSTFKRLIPPFFFNTAIGQHMSYQRYTESYLFTYTILCIQYFFCAPTCRHEFVQKSLAWLILIIAQIGIHPTRRALDHRARYLQPRAESEGSKLCSIILSQNSLLESQGTPTVLRSPTERCDRIRREVL